MKMNLQFFSRGQEINARLQEINAEIEARGDAITAEELAAFEGEVETLTQERAGLIDVAQRRQNLLGGIAAGSDDAAKVVARAGMGGMDRQADIGVETTDRFDTPEYRRHFMEFACRGTPLPVEYRADSVTTTGDVGAVIPTTILNEIIKEMESYGEIFNGVRRLNMQGGVSIPILTLKPTATWVGETTTSNTQKLEAKTSVIFNYYTLECRIAQSLLVSVVTLAEFQRLFVPLATEAMIKAIEIGIIRGKGTNKMSGIIYEPRILTDNCIAMTATEMSSWNGWTSKVFAKMKKSYRDGIFIMAQGTFDAYINGMVDSTGQPIGRVNFGIDGRETYRLAGRQIITVEDELLPFFEDAEESEVVAIYMRLNDYAINTNMQMRTVHWTDHDTNELKNKCIMILDGKVVDPNGILLIKKGK